MSNDGPQILHPQPIRLFSTTPVANEPSSPAPSRDSDDFNTSDSSPSPTAGSRMPNNMTSSSISASSRTRSILNLTASTLYGIYAPEDDASLIGITPLDTEGTTTPSGFVSATPRYTDADRARDELPPTLGAFEHPECRRKPSFTGGSSGGYATQSSSFMRALRGLVRAGLLFGLGVAYGAMVMQLQDKRDLATVRIGGQDRGGWIYFVSWGLAGLLLGTALPVVDVVWDREGLEEKRDRVVARSSAEAVTGLGAARQEEGTRKEGANTLTEAVGLGAEWNPVVRSLGAFIGIGFAIRKLPWQSTLQASLTLSLLNPCLWYTIDRTVPGFVLSAVVGVVGTTVLLGANIVPVFGAATATIMHGSTLAEPILPLGAEQGVFAVWVWIASVLFCSCLCFGNIGRRLALSTSTR